MCLLESNVYAIDMSPYISCSGCRYTCLLSGTTTPVALDFLFRKPTGVCQEKPAQLQVSCPFKGVP